MDVLSEISVRAVAVTIVQLTLIIGLAVWLDRKQEPRTVSVSSTLFGAVLLLLIAAPFWWMLYHIAMVSEEPIRERWIPVLLLFAPFFIAHGWGFYYFRRGGPSDPRTSVASTKPVEPTGTSTAHD